MMHYQRRNLTICALKCLFQPKYSINSTHTCFWSRVDMRAVEVTVQNLIGSGLDPKLENNPYLCFVYTSFQV